MLPDKYVPHLQHTQCTTPRTVPSRWEHRELSTDSFKWHSAPVAENFFLPILRIRQITSCYWWQGGFFFFFLFPEHGREYLDKTPTRYFSRPLVWNKLKKSPSKKGWRVMHLMTVKVSLSCRSCTSRASLQNYYFYTELSASGDTR